MTNKEIKDKNIAAISTIVAHMLLIIALLGFKVKEPQLDKPQTVEVFDVMLGEDELGDGAGENIQEYEPLPSTSPAPTRATVDQPSTTTRTQPSSSRGYVAPDTRSTRPNVNPSETSTRSSTSSSSNSSSTNSSTTTRSKPKATLGSRNSGSGVGRGSGTGQGQSGQAGTQGSPSGSLAYSLGQRKLISSPNRYGSFSQGGKVRMTIYVNRQGRIVRHRVLSSTSSELTSLAVSRLGQIRFNSSSQAPPEQQGTVTFNFRLR